MTTGTASPLLEEAKNVNDAQQQGGSSLRGSLCSTLRLFNAIKDALIEMDKCPEDSVQDIWNECLESWETGLRMDHNYNLANVPHHLPRTAGATDAREAESASGVTAGRG
jgi:hypothetical protein